MTSDLVLLVPRDADWALAIWEATAAGLHRAQQRLPNPNAATQLVLRLYDSAARSGRPRGRTEPLTYPVRSWVGSQLVLLGRPGASHQAVLGVLDSDGTFVAVCRSQVLAQSDTPAAPPDPTAPA